MITRDNGQVQSEEDGSGSVCSRSGRRYGQLKKLNARRLLSLKLDGPLSGVYPSLGSEENQKCSS